MSSNEKLLLQIFERKKWIVDQVKQQSDFYAQYLASTCLIKGIRPPSWLLTSGFEDHDAGGGSADFKDLKKEDLISGLLLPLPRSNHPSTAPNREFLKLQVSDATLITASHASDKHLEGASELNHATSDSPPLHTGARQLDTNNVQSQESLSNIQRSRSRQKALELRKSSSKEQSTYAVGFPEPLNFSNTMNGASCRLRPSASGANHLNSVEKPLQHSSSVNGEDELHYGLDSQPLQNLTFTQKEALMMGANIEHPSKGDMRDKCCGRTTIQIRQVNSAEGLQKPDNFKEVAARVTSSGPISTNNYTQPDSQSSLVQQHDLLHAADAQLIATLSDDGNNIVHQEKFNVAHVDSHFVPNLPVESCSDMVISFGVSKFVVSSPPPDDDLFVEPKQLIFDEAEDCSLSGSSSSYSKEEMRYGSPDKPSSHNPHKKHDAQFLGKDQNLESLNSEENLATSSNAHEEHRISSPGTEKRERDSCPTCSTSLNKGSSEIDNDGFADALPERYKPSVQENVGLQGIALSNKLYNEGASSVHAVLQDSVLRLEVTDCEEVQRAPKSCGEARFEFINGEIECDFHPPLSSGNIISKSSLSSQRGKSKIYGSGGFTTSSNKNKIFKEGDVLSDHFIGLNIKGKCSLGTQLQGVVDRSSINLDTDFIDLNVEKKSSFKSPLQGSVDRNSISLDQESKKALDETCAQKLEVGVHEVSESSKLFGMIDGPNETLSPDVDRVKKLEVGVHEVSESSKLVNMIDGPNETLLPDVDCVTRVSLRKKHELSLGDRQNDSVGAAATRGRSTPTQTVTPESSQINSTRGEISYLSKSINSMKSKKITDTAFENSWPLCKRRKVEGRSSSSVLTTSPRLVRHERVHLVNENDFSKFHRNTEDGLTCEFKHVTSSCYVNDGHPNVDERVSARSAECLNTEKCGPSPKLQATEGDRDKEGGEKDANMSLELMQTFLGTCVDSSLNNEECEYEQVCRSGLIDISSPQTSLEDNQNLLPPGSISNLQNMEETGSIEGSWEGLGSVTGEQLPSYCAVSSPSSEDLDLIVADPSMPEFEGFSIVPPTTEQPFSLSGDGISLEDINLPTTTSERIRVLEKLCRSTSLLTPFPQASGHKIHRTPDVCQSLPNGLLESMDLKTTLHFNDEGFEQLKASFNLIDSEPDLASFSGCMPCPGFQLEWGVGRAPRTPPPVSMLEQRTASVPARHSSEKRQSGNPELTCFRIDEGSSTSEEHVCLDERVGFSQEELSPKETRSSSARRPLVDMTNATTLPSISATKNVRGRGSVDSVNMESCMQATQSNAKQKRMNTCYKDKRAKKDKENQSHSIGGNDVGRAPTRLYRMSPNLSLKASEGSKSQSFSGKGYKRTNIVSNVSSFIPFVQQKQQPAAIATGKREVKVKALEAAEAAKRLEERRENDRKMRREAAKLELNNKKNARKRSRKEEVMKEKERKRKCIEEARRQPKEQDKLRSEKEEKELRCRAAEEKESKKRNLPNEERKHQRPEKGSQVAECKKEIGSGASVGNAAAENAKKASDHPNDSMVSKECGDKVGSTLHEATSCSVTFNEGCDASYDISPYQISDDEEEDEQDIIPTKKYIPAWARERHLASVLPSKQQQVDPCKIFLPSRLCNISGVLLSRLNSK